MNVPDLLLSPSLWLPPVTALAAVGLGAAALLLRDHLRLERHALSLEADVERLRTEIRSLAGAGMARNPRLPDQDRARVRTGCHNTVEAFMIHPAIAAA
jgi:hypothetical protein